MNNELYQTNENEMMKVENIETRYYKVYTTNGLGDIKALVDDLRPYAKEVKAFHVFGFSYLSINGVFDCDSEIDCSEVLWNHRKAVSIQKEYERKPNIAAFYEGDWEDLL